MPLSIIVCKKCYELHGFTLDQRAWNTQGKVWCIYKMKKSEEAHNMWITKGQRYDEDKNEYTSRFLNPPSCCPYDVEHAVNQKER